MTIDRLDEISFLDVDEDDAEAQLCFLAWYGAWKKFKNYLKTDKDLSIKYQRSCRFLKLYRGDISLQALQEALNLSFLLDYRAKGPALRKDVKHWQMEARILQNISEKERHLLKSNPEHIPLTPLMPVTLARIFGGSVEMDSEALRMVQETKLHKDEWHPKAEGLLKRSLYSEYGVQRPEQSTQNSNKGFLSLFKYLRPQNHLK